MVAEVGTDDTLSSGAELSEDADSEYGSDADVDSVSRDGSPRRLSSRRAKSSSVGPLQPIMKREHSADDVSRTSKQNRAARRASVGPLSTTSDKEDETNQVRHFKTCLCVCVCVSWNSIC